MANSVVNLPLGYFPNPNKNQPLGLAKIYIGLVDQDPHAEANRKTVAGRQEDGTIVPLLQPVRTSTGGVPVDDNGNYVTLVVDGLYSMAVDDKNDAQIYYFPDAASVTLDDGSLARSAPLVQPRQTGDGITTTFDSPASAFVDESFFTVNLDGVTQRPLTDYSVDVTGNIVFVEAPPLGVAIDITLYNFYLAQQVVFNTIADAVADESLQIGQSVKTLGYNAQNDGGGAEYVIVAGGTGVQDNNYYHNTAGGKQLRKLSTGIKSRKTAGLDLSEKHDRLAIGVEPVSYNMLVIRSDSNDDTGIGGTVQIQRLSRVDEGFINPKALRVYTKVEGANPQTEWAISGEMDNYSTSTSEGNTAVSGVSNKFSTSNVFAGHFQSQDKTEYITSTDVTPCVGVEINEVVKGLDHPTANDGGGQRILLDMIAISDSDGNPEGSGQVGTGIRIRCDGASRSNGYFRYGIRIEDGKGANPNPVGTGILIRSAGTTGISLTGDNSLAQIFSDGSPEFGIILNGAYASGSAIRLASGQAIGWEGTNVIRQYYDAAGTKLRIDNGVVEKISFITTTTPAILLNGTKVVTTQQAAISDSVGGDEQAKINAILAALRAHGLIAP